MSTQKYSYDLEIFKINLLSLRLDENSPFGLVTILLWLNNMIKNIITNQNSSRT